MLNLTNSEIKILNGMRQSNFSDALQSGGDWTFATIDASGIDPKQARGVISSLIKKGLVDVWDNDGEQCISYTEEGKKLFENADGKECCWGGPKLLKED